LSLPMRLIPPWKWPESSVGWFAIQSLASTFN